MNYKGFTLLKYDDWKAVLMGINAIEVNVIENENYDDQCEELLQDTKDDVVYSYSVDKSFKCKKNRDEIKSFFCENKCDETQCLLKSSLDLALDLLDFDDISEYVEEETLVGSVVPLYVSYSEEIRKNKNMIDEYLKEEV